MVSDQLKLTAEERHCSLWQKLEKLLNERIDSNRRMNDGDLSMEKTSVLRGRISELKKLRHLLAMETSPAQVMDGE